MSEIPVPGRSAWASLDGGVVSDLRHKTSADHANLSTGMLVENAGSPQWGPGKIVHVSGDNLHIIFRDLEEDMARIFRADAPVLRAAQQQSDPVLDNLPPLMEENGRWVLPAKRLTLESVKRRFVHEFPAGFADPGYMAKERDYKLAAHVKFQKLLGVPGIRKLLLDGNHQSLAERALQAVGGLNLLSPYESAAFHDAMQEQGAVQSFFTTLLVVLDADPLTAEVFDKFVDALASLPAARSRVATWPVATLFPYLAAPDRYMFLKPEVSKAAADSLGFDLKYNPALNWTTYEAIQRLGALYLNLLRPLGARDFVDVQSFIWVTCGGYDGTTSKSQTGKK
jgi:hypothetical protein